MNVKELIGFLRLEDPEEEVYFVYDYGDHCHHTVAIPVDDVQYLPLEYSSYT